MKLKLYYCPRACSFVAMNALEEAGLEYDEQVVDIFKGEQHNPEYRAIHPGGKVPALVADDRIITENASIQLFVHGIAPEARLLPETDDPVVRAQHVSDLVWCSSTVHPFARQVRIPIRYTDGDPSGVKAKGEEYLHGVCRQIDANLEEKTWWYGDQWSIVDVYIFWILATAASSGFPVADYANIAGLMDRAPRRPSFQRAKAKQDAAEIAANIQFP